MLILWDGLLNEAVGHHRSDSFRQMFHSALNRRNFSQKLFFYNLECVTIQSYFIEFLLMFH